MPNALPLPSRAVARLRAASREKQGPAKCERMLDMERIQGIGQFKTYVQFARLKTQQIKQDLAQNHRHAAGAG